MTKLEANRANAQRSTGPRTEAGKFRSSRNAISHGLRSQDVVLPHENSGEFDELLAHYRAQVDLSNPEQSFLAEEIAHAQWRLRRAQRLTRLYHALEIEGFSEQPAPDEIIVRNMEQRGDNVPATLHRHEVCFQRLWWRILRKIEQLADKRSEAGFEAFKRQFEQEDRLLSAHIATAGRPHPDEPEAVDPEHLDDIKALAAEVSDEECQPVLETIAFVQSQRTNPIPWCFTTLEDLLDTFPGAALQHFAAILRARIAQTKPLALAA